MRILIVDDDVELVGLLEFALGKEGYDVHAAFDGLRAVEMFEQVLPDLVVLDVNLPYRDGYGVLEQIRTSSRVPVMMLTVRAEEADEIRGLDLGADDYLRKPFSPRTLLARVRALLRRGSDEDAGPALVSGDFHLDPQRMQAWVGESAWFRITPLEERLLRLLLSNKGRPVDSERVIAVVWGDREAGDRDALKQLVHRLRQKLDQHGGAGWLSHVPNAGYAFHPNPGGEDTSIPTSATPPTQEVES